MEASGPLISVVMPTYETEPRHLREAIWSVPPRSYPNWELVIVDDGSTNARQPAGRCALGSLRDERIALRDARAELRHLRRDERGPIEHCRGELVAFLDHDDALTADALLQDGARVRRRGGPTSPTRTRTRSPRGASAPTPSMKPDWSPVYALGAMYVGHLLVVRR